MAPPTDSGTSLTQADPFNPTQDLAGNQVGSLKTPGAVKPPKATRRIDPVPTYCFKVEIALNQAWSAEAFFRSVSGLKFETDVIDVRCGGENTFTVRLPGVTKWGNVTLKRGFSGTSELLDWRMQWIKPGRKQRADVNIRQLNAGLEEIAVWTIKGAMPVRWDISDFDASKSELAIETLELAHHGITFKETKKGKSSSSTSTASSSSASSNSGRYKNAGLSDH